MGFGIDNEEKLRITINQELVEKKNEIYEKFHPVFQRAADKFLRNHNLMRIAIFDKLPGGGDIRIHQHPHLVDESKYRTLTAWLPFTDITVEMGTLYVVQGSHTIFVHKIRTHNDYSAFEGVTTEVIEKYSTPLLLKAGHAAIFDDRIIHWSPPNKSSRIRTAFQLELIPQEAELAIYYRANKKELLYYAIDGKTYRESALTLKKPDNLELLATLKQPYINYNNRRFIAMMQGDNPDNSNRIRNYFHKLFNL